MPEKFLVFDIETTGLPRKFSAALTDFSNWPHIVQIAWILLDEQGTELERNEFIIKPTDYYIPMSVTQVHGISDEYARTHGEDAIMVMGEFYNTISTHRPTLVAHNIRFDVSITGVELLRNQFENVLEQLPQQCTMRAASKVLQLPNNKFPKLSELHFHLFNEDFKGQHRAMPDVEATTRCFFEIRKRIASGAEAVVITAPATAAVVAKPKPKMVLELDDNPEFLYAVKMVSDSSKSFFLTGRAGTGKSTFLKYVQSNLDKKIVIVAPTGVAALNVGGVTIHSFFRFPLRPLLPEDDEIPKLSWEKQKIIKDMDTLIIDEVSMVRVDILDAIDCSLRKNGGKAHLPFGGKQVVFIGDIFQLEPVAEDRDGTKNILLDNYGSVYFFRAQVFGRVGFPPVVELKKVYRQMDDAHFLSLLDKVRTNDMDQETFHLLNQRVDENTATAQSLLEDMTIILKTNNSDADNTNSSILQAIESESYVYRATVSGDFKLGEHRVPAPQELKLKVNAQVMLLKNDLTGRWVNGTIAKVESLSNEAITIRLDNGEIHEVEKWTWENISYQYNRSEGKIETKVLGVYTQYPLRLAWAITIHKSQGLTFEKAKIDWGYRTFASGQVYVALSRCRTLRGITMSRALRPSDIIVNEELKNFHNALPQVVVK